MERVRVQEEDMGEGGEEFEGVAGRTEKEREEISYLIPLPNKREREREESEQFESFPRHFLFLFLFLFTFVHHRMEEDWDWVNNREKEARDNTCFIGEWEFGYHVASPSREPRFHYARLSTKLKMLALGFSSHGRAGWIRFDPTDVVRLLRRLVW